MTLNSVRSRHRRCNRPLPELDEPVGERLNLLQGGGAPIMLGGALEVHHYLSLMQRLAAAAVCGAEQVCSPGFSRRPCSTHLVPAFRVQVRGRRRRRACVSGSSSWSATTSTTKGTKTGGMHVMLVSCCCHRQRQVVSPARCYLPLALVGCEFGRAGDPLLMLLPSAAHRGCAHYCTPRHRSRFTIHGSQVTG